MNLIGALSWALSYAPLTKERQIEVSHKGLILFLIWGHSLRAFLIRRGHTGLYFCGLKRCNLDLLGRRDKEPEDKVPPRFIVSESDMLHYLIWCIHRVWIVELNFGKSSFLQYLLCTCLQIFKASAARIIFKRVQNRKRTKLERICYKSWKCWKFKFRASSCCKLDGGATWQLTNKIASTPRAPSVMMHTL